MDNKIRGKCDIKQILINLADKNVVNFEGLDIYTSGLPPILSMPVSAFITAVILHIVLTFVLSACLSFSITARTVEILVRHSTKWCQQCCGAYAGRSSA